MARLMDYFTYGNEQLNSNKGNPKNVRFLTFKLPATSEICIYRTPICAENCYAKIDNMNHDEKIKAPIRKFRQSCYEKTKEEDFVTNVTEILKRQLKRNGDKKIWVRIHESGDFYSIEYLKKWIEITNCFKNNKKIEFMAYTKASIFIEAYLKKEQKELSDINIKFLFSVMPDTEISQIESLRAAERIGMYKNVVIDSTDNFLENVERCKMDENRDRAREDKIRCADCMKCYEIDADIYGYLRMPRRYNR